MKSHISGIAPTSTLSWSVSTCRVPSMSQIDLLKIGIYQFKTIVNIYFCTVCNWRLQLFNDFGKKIMQQALICFKNQPTNQPYNGSLARTKFCAVLIFMKNVKKMSSWKSKTNLGGYSRYFFAFHLYLLFIYFFFFRAETFPVIMWDDLTFTVILFKQKTISIIPQRKTVNIWLIIRTDTLSWIYIFI